MGGEYLASNVLTPLNPIVWGDKCCLQDNDSSKRSKERSQKERGVIISRYTGREEKLSWEARAEEVMQQRDYFLHGKGKSAKGQGHSD